jgi:SAM-dependent methyltransferase
LDVGGHKLIKRGRFDISKFNMQVVYINLTSSKGADIQADAMFLPVASDQFDALICAELLEHVPEPLAVLKQFQRVLRPNGKLLMCVPFLYRIHADPYDYGRYTDFYWQQNLEKLGFDKVTTDKQGFFYSVILDFFRQYSNYMKIPSPFGRIVRGLTGAILNPLQSWALRHEQNDKVRQNEFITSFTTGFGISATKSNIDKNKF